MFTVHRRAHIEQAVVAGHLREPYAYRRPPRRGGVRVTITGANGFQREGKFAAKVELAPNTAMVRRRWNNKQGP